MIHVHLPYLPVQANDHDTDAHMDDPDVCPAHVHAPIPPDGKPWTFHCTRRRHSSLTQHEAAAFSGTEVPALLVASATWDYDDSCPGALTT